MLRSRSLRMPKKTPEVRENLLIEGPVVEGTRLEVELRVDGDTAIRAARGDKLTVRTSEGLISVDVSSLSLRFEDARVEKGTWQKLSTRPEAALVADRSPAPHVRAELHVRKIESGDRVRIEGLVTGHEFEEVRAPRGKAEKRVSAIRAVRLNPPRERPEAPRQSGARVTRWMPWVIAGIAIAASVSATANAGSARANLTTFVFAMSSLLAARFLYRALVLPPAMDREMAQPFIRLFARAARSLPRFDPEAQGASRWATYFGPLVILGWVYVVSLSTVWPAGLLLTRVDPARMSARGAADLLAGVALALLLLAIGYLVADWGEVGRTRALLRALRSKGDWHAVEGTVRATGAEALYRTVRVESDSLSNSESVDFTAIHESGGTSFRVETSDAIFTVPSRGLDWASDDWHTKNRTARLRVADGARAIVAGFFEGERILERGPHSVLVFASRSGRPEAVLRRALVWRWVDALAAGGASVAVGVIAASFWGA